MNNDGTRSGISAVNLTGKLPHWDMSSVFPGLDSPEFSAAMAALISAIETLQAYFDEQAIGRQSSITIDASSVQVFETCLDSLNEISEQFGTINAYISSFVTTDSRNALAQASLSELDKERVKLSKLGTRFTAWLGSLDIDELMERSQKARDHAYALRKAQIQAQHQMPPGEEDLAAELTLTGSSAWGKLHGNFTSQLAVPIELNGEARVLPMSEIRNLAYHADRNVRQQAYQAELEAWARAEVPLAAAMNSIKGEVNTLSRRRGWDTALDETLFHSNMDRQILDAMMEAAKESFPDFRRYLQAKARMLGLPRLAWYDLFAPVRESQNTWSFSEGANFIIEQFETFSPKMRDLAVRAFRESWIDAEPRVGKRDGAFCMRLRADESRILANYKETFNGVSTLAHELGHAYHNLNLAKRTPLQRATPMTLAETASIFCETVIKKAALEKANPDEALIILEASLQGACQIVVDISSRFLFEQAVFEQRRQRELAASEFCQLMLEAQTQTYGDGLAPDERHPYMWAVKPHYYNGVRSFYNFPYMFGQLFGLGLYAVYKENPDEFRKNYDQLLSSTGMESARDLARRFGMDIASMEFWRNSLNVLKADIDRFENLVAVT
jgi:pepF/M3 family oligoendopeptidase